MKFSELARRLETNGFTILRKKGSIRYYGKPGWPRLIRVDYHGSKGSAIGHMQQHTKGSRPQVACGR